MKGKKIQYLYKVIKAGDTNLETEIPLRIVDELDKAVCYLLTSSRSYIDEPHSYVPMRLLEGASILLNILCSYDEKYIWIKEEVQKVKSLPLSSEEEYLDKMDILLVKLIERY